MKYRVGLIFATLVIAISWVPSSGAGGRTADEPGGGVPFAEKLECATPWVTGESVLWDGGSPGEASPRMAVDNVLNTEAIVHSLDQIREAVDEEDQFEFVINHEVKGVFAVQQVPAGGWVVGSALWCAELPAMP